MNQPKRNQLPSSKQSLFATLKKCWHFLFAKYPLGASSLVFIIILAGIAPSIDSIFLQKITDAIESYSNEDLETINLPAILFMWVVVYGLWWESLNILWRVYDYAYLKIMPKIKAQVIDELYSHIQYQGHGFFQSNLAGDLTSRITEASRSLEMVFAYANEKIVRKLAMLAFALITLYSVHTIIASIFLIWMLVFLGVSLYFSTTINNYSTIYGRDKAMVAGKIVDAVSNISAIRMFTTHRHEHKYLRKYIDKSVRSDQAMQWFLFKLRYALGTSCTIMICSMIYYIITLRGEGAISIGQCVLIITLCLATVTDIFDFTQEFGELFEQIGIFNQSMSLLEEYKILDKPNAQALTITKPTIEFQNVTFNYQNNNNSFDNKSIKIKEFERVGLVGFSGSGKTTFAGLISRLYEIKSGNIFIDGQDIQNVTQESLRKNISIIPQEAILFHRSIKDNIKYGNLDASDTDMYEAAKSAHTHEFITNLPDGYDTICGERGNNLSGGQRQRIVIARAFLKDAPILILDEATSSLDSYTEQLIQKSLQQLMLNKTVLIIAHRLSTLLHMDRILVFDKGHIVEDGPHSKLQTKGAIYKELWDSY